jgi:predicted ATPase/DNA-binding SARP family transcriptional activator
VLIRILGPLELAGTDPVPTVAGARLRRLLVRLAWDASRTVSGRELIDAVWLDDDTPADVANALQSLTSRLRRALGTAAAITQHEGGYRLTVERPDVDAHAFTTAARDGHAAVLAGRHTDAVDVLSAALACWRGIALQDADSAAYAVSARRRLDETRLDAIADRNDAQLALGGADGLVAELEALVGAHPLRERFTAQLMTALAGTGRSAEALAAYEHLRRFLADELGTDPSPRVQDVHLAVLRGQVPVGVTPTPTGPGGPTVDDPDPVVTKTNLRSSISSFVGRDAELERVDELIAKGRLTTLVGPGGAGKTRLANEVAARWVGRVESGVWFVELAPVTDPDGVAEAVLSAMGVRTTRVLERLLDRQDTDTARRLFTTLADAQALLVIDNCEHLIGPTAELVDDLLAHCPRVRVLTTSREPLNIAGEALCAVPPLRLPAVDATAAEASTSAAVQLFIERAASANAGFRLDEGTVGHVVEIVRRLDGLPLAIELAAARLRVLPVSEIAARLDDRFRLLTGGSRTAMPRHRTLRAVVEWSWDLLEHDERTLAQRLAVFPAGATADGARAVCAEVDDIDAVLDALVDKSLLQVPIAAEGSDAAATPVVRYRMLETIREFGIERLEEAGELAGTRGRHARYFASLVAQLEPMLRTGRQPQALRRIRVDHDNILAALRFLGDDGSINDALELIINLGWYWTIVGGHSEASNWLSWALEMSEGTDSVRRRLIKAMAAVELIQTADAGPSDWTTVQKTMGEAAAVFDDIDDLGSIGLSDGAETLAYGIRALLAFFSGDLDTGERIIGEAVQHRDPWRRATGRIMRAAMDENLGNVERMRADAALAIAEFTEIGDLWGLSSGLALRSRLLALDGDTLGAITDIKAAMRLAAEIGSDEDASMLNFRLADLYTRIGDTDAAMAALAVVRTSTSDSFRGRERGMFADVAEAGIAATMGDITTARRLTDAVRDRIGSVDEVAPVAGHLTALALAGSAWVEVIDGNAGQAHADLIIAMRAAVSTFDLPVVANVGVVVAALTELTGDATAAATMLGAAARLRGAADWGDPGVRRVTDRLRAALGVRAFDAAYVIGADADRDTAISLLTPPPA